MNLTPCPPLLIRRGGTQFAALSPLRSPLLLGEGTGERFRVKVKGEGTGERFRIKVKGMGQGRGSG